MKNKLILFGLISFGLTGLLALIIGQAVIDAFGQPSLEKFLIGLLIVIGYTFVLSIFQQKLSGQTPPKRRTKKFIEIAQPGDFSHKELEITRQYSTANFLGAITAISLYVAIFQRQHWRGALNLIIFLSIFETYSYFRDRRRIKGYTSKEIFK